MKDLELFSEFLFYKVLELADWNFTGMYIRVTRPDRIGSELTTGLAASIKGAGQIILL